MPSSLWKPGYSGRLRFKTFSISSIARDSWPSNLERVSAYREGISRRRYRDPDVSSHFSPLCRMGRPTRISLWMFVCRGGGGGGGGARGGAGRGGGGARARGARGRRRRGPPRPRGGGGRGGAGRHG